MRLREPLMQRQMARQVERRKREDEAWSRIEDEEKLLRQTKGRGPPQHRRDAIEEKEWKQEEAVERAGVLEEQMRQARVEERRGVTRRAGGRRPAVPPGWRQDEQLEDRGDVSLMDERSRQAELYLRQRLARKVGGFADIVTMTAMEDQRDAEPSDVLRKRDGTAGREVVDDVFFLRDDQWDW